MKRLEPLQPVFDFSSIPESVSLARGNAKLTWGDGIYEGNGEVLLKFLPRPDIVIKAKFDRGVEEDVVWGDFEKMKSSFDWDGKGIEGFAGRWRADVCGIDWSWVPRTLPLEMGDMQAEKTVAVMSHIFNFPDFRGGKYQETAAPEDRALLWLESDEWRITLQSLPNNATYHASKRIKEEGGCFLTHVAKLERVDGTAFSGKIAQEQLYDLSRFLSFAVGGDFQAVCSIGLDASGARTWENFAVPRALNSGPSWFNRQRAHQLEKLFPLFIKRWQQSDGWRDCLQHAIYWYTQANTDGSFLGIQSAIILAQAALERLAYHYAVIDRQMISVEGFDKLTGSDRLRILLVGLGIPIAIDRLTPKFLPAPKKSKWVDRPHALVEIRNSLVHSKGRKYENECYIGAWKLSLWYLELSILALCGYDDVYQNRLEPTPYPGQLPRVPWYGNRGGL